ncbi:MAG: cysteine methyltransferase [Thiotrichales bacterium SG8_50]|nr:MAG: cysteine methyltransferase [Thiotrichales bacterium SG8_50]
MNSAFNDKCYELLRQIPEGMVTTYREMARAMGTRAWRAVGTAMAKNTDLVATPCHRVIRSGGAVGQYALGTQKKVELLLGEGVEISNGKVCDLEKYVYRFGT